MEPEALPAGTLTTRDFGLPLALAALTVGLAGCASLVPVPPLADRVDALLAPRVAANEFSGAVVLARRGEILYQRGFGMANRARGLAFAPETPSDGGSMAKTFTAAGLWWLAHEGRVELDAPARRYLPDYPHAGTTVRELISHTNGLPPSYEFFDAHFGKDEVRTTDAMLRIVAREAPAPAFPPGSRFEYSNLGFDAAARIIERITGQSYEAFVGERFFSPLAMRASFARPARFADWPGVRTQGYRHRKGGWEDHDAYDNEAFLGASNLIFSAADLSRWASAHAKGTALPPAVLAAGQARHAIGGQPSPITGLSWYCDGSGARCYYTGSLNAFHVFAYWDRQREESVAFVSNGTTPPWQVITLQRDLVDALAGRTTGTRPTPAFGSFDKTTRAGLAGTYVGESVGKVIVAGDADSLRVRMGAGLEYDAFPVSREVLYLPGPDLWLAFDPGQPPATMYIRSMFLDSVARRPASGAR